jgi:hypothetical protein
MPIFYVNKERVDIGKGAPRTDSKAKSTGTATTRRT